MKQIIGLMFILILFVIISCDLFGPLTPVDDNSNGSGVSSSASSGSSSSYSAFSAITQNFDLIDVTRIPDNWFESGDANTSAEVVDTATTAPVSTANCLRLYDGSSVESAGANFYIQSSNYGQMVFSVKNSSAGTGSQFGFILTDSSSVQILELLFNIDNMITVKTDSGSFIIVYSSYNDDTWISVEIDWDIASGYFKLLINSISIGTYPLMSSGVPYRVKFMGGSSTDSSINNSTSFVDNINYTADAIPVDGSGTFVFRENFDTTSAGSIPAGFSEITNADVDCEVISEITAHSSANCLKIYDSSTVNRAVFVKDLGMNEPYGQFTYYFYIPASSPWAGTLIEDASQVLANICFQSAGGRVITLNNNTGGTIATLGSYNVNTWNKLAVKWDASIFKFKVILNDVDLGTYSFLANSIPCKLSFITQANESGHLNYYDDLSFTRYNELIE